MKIFKLFILFIMIISVGANAASGPHGGKLVQGKEHKAEVKINHDTGDIEVYILSKKKEASSAPRELGISLYNDSGSKVEISLRSSSTENPDEYPKYEGKLDFPQVGWVGFELRIPFFEENHSETLNAKF